MKYVVIALVLVAAGAGLWWWRGRTVQNGGPVYTTAAVERDEIHVTVSASGTINPVATVSVGSQVSGRIQDLYADFNSVVTCGQVVAQLEESPFVTRVRQSEATLAKATYGRLKTLAEQHVISSAELDDALAKYEQAAAEEMQAQASLDSARIDMEHATIYSPVDGTVLSRLVDVGQTVAASFQAPELFKIAADLTKMQIEAKVDEADVGQVAEGQTVTFTVDAYPGHTFTGAVRQIRNAPVIVQNVVSYDTIIVVNNDDLKLRPGMTATTTILVNNRSDVLVIPNAALRVKLPLALAGRAAESGLRPGARRGAPQPSVYVLRNGVPHATPVETGVTDGSSTEIISGLNEGDMVVTGYSTAAGAAAARRTVNPFSGPQSGRGPR